MHHHDSCRRLFLIWGAEGKGSSRLSGCVRWLEAPDLQEWLDRAGVDVMNGLTEYENQAAAQPLQESVVPESVATTIGIVPHEKFSVTRENLESVLAATPEPHRLVYVDGGSPQPVAEYLETQARMHDFTLVRTDHYLRPNEGRNLAFAFVDTEFLALIDNDVVVDPGWLASLERCARSDGGRRRFAPVLYRPHGSCPGSSHDRRVSNPRERRSS